MRKHPPDITKSRIVLITGALFLLSIILFASGCGPQPPVPYQELQVQDTEASEGWDVYLFVAIDRNSTAEEVTTLLEWFRDDRFADVNRIRIFIWNNPQAALMMGSGDLMGEITTDREAETERLDIYVD